MLQVNRKCNGNDVTFHLAKTEHCGQQLLWLWSDHFKLMGAENEGVFNIFCSDQEQGMDLFSDPTAYISFNSRNNSV